MTMFGSGKDTIIECNFCGIEVHRFKNHWCPMGMFNKPFKVLCRECENKRNQTLLKIDKSLKRSLKIAEGLQNES